jgi:hypothetical protein
MAAFSELDWTRFDVWAIVAMDGVVVVKPDHREASHAWLQHQNYALYSIDFGQGIRQGVVALGELFQWEKQFGYSLKPDNCNLNALRDGFGFGLNPDKGQVLEFLGAETAYKEDPYWFEGLLAVAHEYTRNELAIGNRFFTSLILDTGSPLVGVRYQQLSVPIPYWRSGNMPDPFTLPDV